MAATDESRALAVWGLTEADVVPLAGGTANRNFRVRHDGHLYFLRRRSPRYVDPAQIAFDHALMVHLSRLGVLGPNPLKTSSGETTVRVEEGVYELHPFIRGRPIEWDNADDLRQAARALSRFHDATADFSAPAPKDWPRDDAPASIRAGLQELRDALAEPAHIALLDELERWTDRIENALPDDRYWLLPNQVIHGDFHPGNALVTQSGVALFDLDCASCQPRARDVADAFLYFCARRDGPFDSTTIVRLTRECWLEPDRNRCFLEAYGGLEDEELEALPWLVAARWTFSRVHGRRKLPREAWPEYATAGMLTPPAPARGKPTAIALEWTSRPGSRYRSLPSASLRAGLRPARQSQRVPPTSRRVPPSNSFEGAVNEPNLLPSACYVAPPSRPCGSGVF